MRVNSTPEQRDDIPADAYGPGYLVYSLHTDFRSLCRHIGFERAREEMAIIINMEAEGRRKSS